MTEITQTHNAMPHQENGDETVKYENDTYISDLIVPSNHFIAY